MSQTLLYVSSRRDSADELAVVLGSSWRVVHAPDAVDALATLRHADVHVVATEAELDGLAGSALLTLVARVDDEVARVLVGDHWRARETRPDAHLVLPAAASVSLLAEGICRAAMLRDALGGFGLRALGRRSRSKRITSAGPVSRPLW